MKPINQKERAIALLAGNGAVVLQAILTIGQTMLQPASALAKGGLMFCLAGIAAVGLWGSMRAYQALARAGDSSKLTIERCERAILHSFIALGGNVGTGLVVIMIGGLILMTTAKG